MEGLHQIDTLYMKGKRPGIGFLEGTEKFFSSIIFCRCNYIDKSVSLYLFIIIAAFLHCKKNCQHVNLGEGEAALTSSKRRASYTVDIHKFTQQNRTFTQRRPSFTAY